MHLATYNRFRQLKNSQKNLKKIPKLFFGIINRIKLWPMKYSIMWDTLVLVIFFTSLNCLVSFVEVGAFLRVPAEQKLKIANKLCSKYWGP